ncbi:MAG: hypothetical protein M3220_22560 [Chloroflexota bacterium]|nr:hypothetical protein [Chloroflexota bacterium]
MRTLTDEMVTGAIGGLAGGMMMTAFMTGATKAGVIDETLPHKVEQYAEEQLDQQEQTDLTQERAFAQGGHLVYSAALGALYGALRHSMDDPPPLPTGPAYGLGIYAINLLGIGPQLGITRRPWNEEPTTVGRQIMMHAMFGAVTALAQEELLQRGFDVPTPDVGSKVAGQ